MVGRTPDRADGMGRDELKRTRQPTEALGIPGVFFFCYTYGMSKMNQEFENEAVVSFLIGAIDKANSMVQHIDDQTNIIIGVGTAIFVFATARYDSAGNNKLTFLILGTFAALSAIVGLFALHPPRFMRKKGQGESLMFPTHIAGVSDIKAYTALMEKAVKSQTEVVAECSKELYNISRYYYVPKRSLYRRSRDLLMSGIVISLIVFLLGLKF